ncbi:glycosyltransferase family 25 protein [Rhodohalobacter mucosus]|uniref:Glycosyl transferase family 25 domain-containing protein n=1 Tax=Rhodohalobacter mucosus TaxID=2079485 RepID=A0A316TVI1_9BACT|nr:glycosyltransferase family 25 protein [Rhodohalobacter mucosus]PWN07821.1 hypothetical protein DDZ15_02070 [Rhodohalobacter mucosus]
MSSKEAIFKLINRSFDQVFLISLKKSNDRREKLKDILNGLDYEIFWGVNGSELDLNELELSGKLDNSGRYQQNRPPLSSGEVGCALSHLGIYQTILERGLKNALILEDDLVVDQSNPGLPGTLEQSFSELPPDWDLLYLGYADNNNAISPGGLLRAWAIYPLLYLFNRERFNPAKFRRRFPRNYSQNLQRAGYHYRTHAYGVSNNGAKKILGFQTPVAYASDNAISEMCTTKAINAFRVKNRVFYQNRDLETTIKGRYIDKGKSPHRH